MNAPLRRAVRHWLVAPLAVALLVAACGVGSRVNADNYEKIQNGMTRDAVHDLLGKPDEVSGTGIGELTLASEVWHGHDQTIHVSFFNDHVKLKSIGNESESKGQ